MLCQTNVSFYRRRNVPSIKQSHIIKEVHEMILKTIVFMGVLCLTKIALECFILLSGLFVAFYF